MSPGGRDSSKMSPAHRDSFLSHFLLLRGVFLHLNWGDFDHIRCSNWVSRPIFDLRGSVLALDDYFALAEKLIFQALLDVSHSCLPS